MTVVSHTVASGSSHYSRAVPASRAELSVLVQVAGMREERRRWQELLAAQATLQDEVGIWKHRCAHLQVSSVAQGAKAGLASGMGNEYEVWASHRTW